MNHTQEKRLRNIAVDLREDIVRIGHKCELGVHLGGTLSLAEVLSVLYFHVLRVKPSDPQWPGRDRLVLSKGHGNVGLLAALARRGFLPLEDLIHFNKLMCPYSMHADHKRTPGVEASAGSLGHGLPIAVGMALSSRLGETPWRTYCLLSDGEMMEGSSWEAMMAGAHYQLDSLTAIVDRNRLSLDGYTEDVMSLEPLSEKCRAFGWVTLEVDGHDVAALVDALSPTAGEAGRPKMVIAHTVKGSGVSFLEDRASSHFGHLTEDEAQQAQAELDQMRARIT